MRSVRKALTGRQISKRRWRGDEEAPGLTWGRLMTGDSLWDIYQRNYTFTLTDRILEIGPGYGRLLKTALERNIPFASYTGVELSAGRVEKLNEEFRTGKIQFLVGDIETWHGPHEFDIVICSSTFEHLYPDCRRAIENISNQLASRAILFVDFIRATNDGWSIFDDNGTYVRAYSQAELRALFANSKLKKIDIENSTLGIGVNGPVERSVVIAKKL